MSLPANFPGPAAPPAKPPGPTLEPLPGVVFTPSDRIASSLKRMVADELGRIPPGQRGVMARVDVQTGKGVNAVIAYKTASGWQAGAWVGKSGWDRVAGVSVGKIWA